MSNTFSFTTKRKSDRHQKLSLAARSIGVQNVEDREEDEQFEDCFEEFPAKNEEGAVDYSGCDDEFEDCLDYFITYDKRISDFLERQVLVTCLRSAQVCVKSTWGSISLEREREREQTKPEAENVNGTEYDDRTDTTSGRRECTIRDLPCGDQGITREDKEVQCTMNKGISLAENNGSRLQDYRFCIEYAKKMFALQDLKADVDLLIENTYLNKCDIAEISLLMKDEAISKEVIFDETRPKVQNGDTYANAYTKDGSNNRWSRKLERLRENTDDENDRIPFLHDTKSQIVRQKQVDTNKSNNDSDKTCLTEKAGRDIRSSSAWFSTLLVFVCCLPMTTGMLSSSNIEWTTASMPAVLGENLTLTCSIPDKVNSLSWHREPSELLAMENYPSDRNKFEITTSEVGNITQYNITIMNLNMSDIDRWYRCSNGNDWEQKKLNFTEDGLISKPSDEDITKIIRKVNGAQIVSLTIDKIFPLPVCELDVMHKLSAIIPEKILSEVEGSFKLEYNFVIQPCSEQVTLLCMLAKERVVQEFLAGIGTSDECPEAHDDIKETFIGTIIGLIIIMTLILVVWWKRRGRIQYQTTSQNEKDKETSLCV